MEEGKIVSVQIGSEVREYPAGISYEEVAKDYQERMTHKIVLAWADGRLRELQNCVDSDCYLSFLTTADKIGFQTYRRSMVHLLIDRKSVV